MEGAACKCLLFLVLSVAPMVQGRPRSAQVGHVDSRFGAGWAFGKSGIHIETFVFCLLDACYVASACKAAAEPHMDQALPYIALNLINPKRSQRPGSCVLPSVAAECSVL